jgi:hypothetical protein
MSRQLYTVDTFSSGSPMGVTWMLGSGVGPLLWSAFLVLGIIAWVALARSSLVHGGGMERSDRVPQLYGYSVCLVAIVVMLVNVTSLVNTAFTLSDPLASRGEFGWPGPVLTSFEAFRATADRLQMVSVGPGGTESTTKPKLTDAELRARYEALRADQLQRTKLEAQRTMTTSILLLILSAALFVWHWRWVRRITHTDRT